MIPAIPRRAALVGGGGVVGAQDAARHDAPDDITALARARRLVHKHGQLFFT